MGSTFWRRHRKKIIAAAAVSAAGAAAAYYWWNSTEKDQERKRRQEHVLGTYSNIHEGAQSQQDQPGAATAGHRAAAAAGSSTGESTAASPGAAGTPSLDDSLQQHFTSIQELSDRQALEDLLPRLREVVMQATNYEPLREQLRSSSASSLSSDEKLELWRGLAIHSFCRALAAVWLVPLLDLLVRLKLHIVGRHMYLESKLPQLQSQGAGNRHRALGAALGGAAYERLALPPCLSDRAKEEFFRCDYFIDVGTMGLLHKLRSAVERSLAGVDFGGSMTQQDVEALVVTMHAAFEESFARAEDLWAAYLVPPGPAPVSVRTASGVEALLSPVEAAMVDELNNELREVLSDFRFGEALRGAVRHTSKSIGAYISSKMGGSGGSALQSMSAAAAGASSLLAQRHGSISEASTSAAAATTGKVEDARQLSEEAAESPGSVTGASAVRPFPYVVPIVAKSGQLLFDETNRCTKGISGLRGVQALCASVFTFGPHIY